MQVLPKLFTWVLSSDGQVKHEVLRNLDIIRALDGQVISDKLEIWTTDADEEYAARLLKNRGARPLVALAPGAREEKRRWPLDNYVALATWLRDYVGADIAVLGGPGEESLGEVLAQALGRSALNLVGRTTIRQAAAVLRRCHLFVGNDSGLMHVAAAVNVPVIEISSHAHAADPGSPNSPERFGPWGVPSVVLRPERPTPPCQQHCTAQEPHCIRKVTVESAQRAIQSLLLARNCTLGLR